MKAMWWKGVSAVVVAVLLVGGAPTGRMCAAGEESGASTRPATRSGPLAGLPSAPAAHLEKIRALGEDAWVNLGPPAADPDFSVGKEKGHPPYSRRGRYLHRPRKAGPAKTHPLSRG